jgi:DNA-binding CsgD family transcriptional regulator
MPLSSSQKQRANLRLEEVFAQAQATSAAGIVDRYRRQMALFGYDELSYFAMNEKQEVVPGPNTVFTYSGDWSAHYDASGFACIDPVGHRLGIALRPFEWYSEQTVGALTRKQEVLMSESLEAGLHNGIGIPLLNHGGSRHAMTLASSTKGIVSSRVRDLCIFLAQQSHFAISALEEHSPIETALTTREREILTRCAMGETNTEIADHLGLSQRIVRFHMASTIKKLNAENRVSATVKAIRLGLITP